MNSLELRDCLPHFGEVSPQPCIDGYRSAFEDWYEVIGVVRELGVGAPTQVGRAAGFYIPATPGSESDLTLQGMAMTVGYGIVMLGVCMLGCVVPTRRALNIEPTIALRTE